MLKLNHTEVSNIYIFFPTLDLLADILKDKPVEDGSLNNIIIVDNAPKVGPDRLERLKSVLKKIFSKFGAIVTEYYPLDENNVFKGLARNARCVSLFVCWLLVFISLSC